jgi:hypothetical protein
MQTKMACGRRTAPSAQLRCRAPFGRRPAVS